jgi:hypothetical protein
MDEKEARIEESLYVARWNAIAALFPDREALAAANQQKPMNHRSLTVLPHLSPST